MLQFSKKNLVVRLEISQKFQQTSTLSWIMAATTSTRQKVSVFGVFLTYSDVLTKGS